MTLWHVPGTACEDASLCSTELRTGEKEIRDRVVSSEDGKFRVWRAPPGKLPLVQGFRRHPRNFLLAHIQLVFFSVVLRQDLGVLCL